MSRSLVRRSGLILRLRHAALCLRHFFLSMSQFFGSILSVRDTFYELSYAIHKVYFTDLQKLEISSLARHL